MIGIVGKTRFYNLRDDSLPLLFDALAQNYRGNGTLVVRFSGPAAPLTTAIAQIVRQLDPDLPLFGIRTLQQQIVESPAGLMPYRFGAILAGAHLVRVHDVLAMRAAVNVADAILRNAV